MPDENLNLPSDSNNLDENNKANQKNNVPKKNLVDPGDVESYILINRELFPSVKLIYLKSKLLQLDKDEFEKVCLCDLKSPTIILLISIFLGGLGVDRFLLGDIGMGILKLLTGGLCGVFWFYDLFTISERVRKINFENIILLT